MAMFRQLIFAAGVLSLGLGSFVLAIEPPKAAEPAVSLIRVATFDVDATPPVGSLMAYDPVTNKWDLGLRARGIVILGADQPIVLCAVDATV